MPEGYWSQGEWISMKGNDSQKCPTCKEPAEPRGTGWFCKKCGFRFWIDDWEDVARWNSELISWNENDT